MENFHKKEKREKKEKKKKNRIADTRVPIVSLVSIHGFGFSFFLS
jgi:hypothetical protein